MDVSLRVVAVLLLWGSLALGILGAVLLFAVGVRDAQAVAGRLAGRPERVRAGLGVTSLDPATLEAAARRAGELSRRGELPHLALRGTPYQRGFAHGHLLGEDVRTQYDRLFHRIRGRAAGHAGRWYASRVGFDRDGPVGDLLEELLDLPLVRAGVRDAFLDDVWELLRPHVPAHLLAEMDGLADGAGLDPQAVRRFHAISEVASAGCSNLAAWGRATAGGSFIQYRNLDWSLALGVQEQPLLLEHEADAAGSRRGHLTAGFAGFLGALQGLNEEGITLGEVGAGSRKLSYDGQPMVFRLRRVLEEAGDLDAVVRIMQEPDRTKGYGFLVGHIPARDARAFEQNRDRTAVFLPGDPREAASPHAYSFPDVSLRGDFAVDPEIRRHQHAAGGPGDPTGSYSYVHRYQLLGTSVEASYGELDRARVEAIARASGEKSQNLVSVIYTEDAFHVSYAKGATKASSRDFLAIPYESTRVLAGIPGKVAAAGRARGGDSGP